MAATTFAADTLLAISGLVVKQGIWGNWFWWSQIPIFVGGVFFFYRLWRRAQFLTDTQVVEFRYSGRSWLASGSARKYGWSIVYAAKFLACGIKYCGRLSGFVWRLATFPGYRLDWLVAVRGGFGSGVTGDGQFIQ